MSHPQSLAHRVASPVPPCFLSIQRYPFFEEAVIRPVGRQRFHDVKPAVMGDDAVVAQVIRQICDLRETLII